MRKVVYFCALILFLVGSATVNAATPATSDTSGKTPSGATFVVPKSWSAETAASQIILAPPENDFHIAIVDISGAKDAAAAVTSAWNIYRPGANRVVKLASPLPTWQGWDERESFSYETSPNEHVFISAEVRRSGTNWTVLIFDGALGTFEKRIAGVAEVLQSLRPPGYKRESFAGLKANPLDTAHIAALTSFVQTSMRQLGIPGSALAFIDRGKIVFEGGFGVRELGKPDPVDANTLFMIASNTKGMTTLLLAELVDQGKIAWDEPVTQVYPSFRLGSDATTRQVLMRHLVCACTGLPRKDFEWIFNTRRTTPASTTFDLLAATQPTSGFGEIYQYNNLMASAAGYIAGHLVYPDRELGAAYDAAMQKLVFDPLAMHETTFDMQRALRSNHASPHGDDMNGKTTVASMDMNYASVPYRPAGGAWSSAHDLIRYVQNELTLGDDSGGKRIVSARNLLQRRVPSVSMGEDRFYGMGLSGDTSWGVTVIHHGGSLSGYKSDIIFLPDAGVGAVILTNADDGGLLLYPFTRRLVEVLYDGKPEAAANVAAAAANNQAYIAKERTRLVIPAAPGVVAGLAASYSNPDLGNLTIRHQGDDTVFDFGAWKSKVASRKNDDGTISLVTIDPTVLGFQFVIATRSGKRALIIRDGQHEYAYVEKT